MDTENGLVPRGAIAPVSRLAALVSLLAALLVAPAQAQTSVPDAIAVPGGKPVMTVFAVGAQIYECTADASGKPAWQFREPIATLTLNGRTVGRHFAGPSWQLADGSLVVGKVAGRAPGATAADIPLLKLDAAEGKGSGQFANVVVIQRINTKGGVLAGPCEAAGMFQAVPYTSDYVFVAKGG